MKFDRKHKIHKVVSDDELRPAIQHIYVDNGKMVATNRFCIAIVPVEDSDLLNHRLVPAEAIKDALKTKKKDGDPSIESSIDDSHSVFVPATGKQYEADPALKYVAYDRAVPSKEKSEKQEYHHRVSLNAKMLYELSEALGDDAGFNQITIYFPKDPNEMMKVVPFDGGDAYAFFMPVQSD